MPHNHMTLTERRRSYQRQKFITLEKLGNIRLAGHSSPLTTRLLDCTTSSEQTSLALPSIPGRMAQW